ncbi:MAG: OsmC family protein [Terriglobales bacterium]
MAQVAEAAAQWTDGERFLASGSSGHAVVMDADRGRNSAPGPMEMVLMALCACTGTDVLDILRKKRQPAAGLTVRARAERAAQPPMVYTRIVLEYEITGAVEAKAAEDAMRLSREKYCSVMAMLSSTAAIITELRLAGAAAGGAGR